MSPTVVSSGGRSPGEGGGVAGEGERSSHGPEGAQVARDGDAGSPDEQRAADGRELAEGQLAVPSRPRDHGDGPLAAVRGPVTLQVGRRSEGPGALCGRRLREEPVCADGLLPEASSTRRATVHLEEVPFASRSFAHQIAWLGRTASSAAWDAVEWARSGLVAMLIRAASQL
jgi:hypothetical protein